MGRVGRYGQECSRWKLPEVEELVNDKQSRKLRLDIMDLCKDIQGMGKKKKWMKNMNADKNMYADKNINADKNIMQTRIWMQTNEMKNMYADKNW